MLFSARKISSLVYCGLVWFGQNAKNWECEKANFSILGKFATGVFLDKGMCAKWDWQLIFMALFQKQKKRVKQKRQSERFSL